MTFGSVTIASPTSAPPTTTWRTPSGRPASRKTAANIAPPQTGVCGSGFRITALPTASAGATTRIPSTLGEFHGVIAPMTPTGTRRSIDSRPGTTLGTSWPYGWNGIVAAALSSPDGEVLLVVHLAVDGAGLALRPGPELRPVGLVDHGRPTEDRGPLVVARLGPGRLGRGRGGRCPRDVVGGGLGERQERPAARGLADLARLAGPGLPVREERIEPARALGTGRASQAPSVAIGCSFRRRGRRTAPRTCAARRGRPHAGRSPGRARSGPRARTASIRPSSRYGGSSHDRTVSASWPG